jgi:6-phosphogluconolactonase
VVTVAHATRFARQNTSLTTRSASAAFRRPRPDASYAIDADGGLTLVNATAAGSSTAPLLDASVSGDGRFLSVVDVGGSAIDAFQIGSGGSLTPVGTTTGLPAGSGGLAAS